VPRDIVSQVLDRATYLGQPPDLGAQALRWAWRNYHASDVPLVPLTDEAGAGAGETT